MSCTQIEQLIPLYTGGDLSAEEETVVRDHLATCERCEAIAGEFAESRDWLRGFTPPQIDQPVFDDLRDQVLTKIVRAQTRPSLFELLTPIWNRSVVLAAVSALLLLVAGMIVYLNRRPVSTPDLTQKDKKDVPQINAENPIRNAKPSGEKPLVLYSSVRSKIYRLPYIPAPDPKTIALLPNPLDLRQVMGEGVNLLVDENQTAEVDATQEMMRFEFQTADPNIRIIWLTPKESKHNGETR